MSYRQPRKKRTELLPRLWLVTDERQGKALLPSIEALPFGSGILFRHYHTPVIERRRVFDAIRHIADQSGHWVIISDDVATAKRWRADGVHLTKAIKSRTNARRYARNAGLIVSMTAHDKREMAYANRLADMIFVSPIYPTTSHPGAATLGERGFEALADYAHRPVIALGGLNKRNSPRIMELGAYGWAAIDGLTEC